MFGCLQNFLLDMLKVLLMLRSTALGLKKITVAFLVFKRSLRFTQSQTFTLAVGTRLRLLEQDSELAMLIFMSFLSSWDAVLLLPKKMGTTLVQQDKLCGEAALCEDVQKLLSVVSPNAGYSTGWHVLLALQRSSDILEDRLLGRGDLF